MTVLVDPYRLRESERRNIKQCYECTYVPVWEIRQQIAEKPSVGYACSEHVDTVLYLVTRGLIKTDKEQASGVITEPGQG